jgi:choloylglycine hydrolase
VIEFLEGKMVAHKTEEMYVAALANSPYAESLEYLNQFRGFGGQKSIPQTTASRDRFARAAYGVKLFQVGKGDDIIGQAFKILENVSQGPATRWSIVYDLKNPAVQFRTSTSPDIKTLALKDFDFSCERPCRVLDIDTKEPGNVYERFVDYSLEINKKLIFESWKTTEFLKDTPDAVLNLLAVYPDTIKPVKEEVEQG